MIEFSTTSSDRAATRMQSWLPSPNPTQVPPIRTRQGFPGRIISMRAPLTNPMSARRLAELFVALIPTTAPCLPTSRLRSVSQRTIASADALLVDTSIALRSESCTSATRSPEWIRFPVARSARSFRRQATRVSERLNSRNAKLHLCSIPNWYLRRFPDGEHASIDQTRLRAPIALPRAPTVCFCGADGSTGNPVASS